MTAPSGRPPPSGGPASVGPGPYFSVLVTAYRRRTFVREAVQSVLDQSVPRSDVEVIVIKDFTDAELDGWLAGLGPSVQTVTEDLPRIGQMLVRGLSRARGEVFCFLDDDDRFRPMKLEGLRALFGADRTLGLVRNSYDAIDFDGRPIPSWERFRPQPPDAATWGPGHEDVRFPWLYRFGGYVNESTISVRTSVARPWSEWLDRVTASCDIALFTVALASGVGVRVEPARWNDYRVHASTSHPAIVDGNEALDLRDVQRSLATAEVLRAAVASAPGHPAAVRMSESFRLESAAVAFLLDPGARFSFGDWLRFARTILWRRQAYLGTLWVYCLRRWFRPRATVRAYRARRHGDLRRSATAASGGSPVGESRP
ncbi:MAG: glycosyltransferase family 2 protein [Thermoplasmata archaeon]